jgi:microcystin degradation protein MlrC
MKNIIILFSSLCLFITSCNETHQQRQKRILTLGIRNESNTFSTLPTKEADFNLLRGAEVVKNEQWADVLKKEGVQIIPTLHAYAWPGGKVEKKAFDKFKNEILDSIRLHAGEIDAIYMDMHGALHVEGYDDAQAILIKEIREVVGKNIIIGGSFDLHGNLSKEFVDEINILTAYRTAPHRDGEETKTRAVSLIMDVLNNNLKPYITCVTIPIIVPGEKSITEVEPLHSIYAQIPSVSNIEGLLDASIFAGYCWADLPRSAMRVFVVAKDKKYADTAHDNAIRLAQQIWDKKEEMILDVPSGSIDEMLVKAKEYKGKTVFISDSGDNTTAGAPGDNTQVLDAMLKQNIKNALIAGIVDKDALEACKNAGLGKDVKLTLGGKVDYVFGKPSNITGKVLYLSPDNIVGTNREAAILNVNGTKLVIMNARRSFVKMSDFSEVGLNPLDFDIVVVKLGYLYPELRDMAPVHLMALTSGFCNLDMTALPFKHITRPCYPLDADMEWRSIIK